MIESEETIKSFYNSIKDKYPDLEYAQIQEICRNPFIFVKAAMKSKLFPEIRLKYFGTFKVNLGRAKAQLKETIRIFGLNRIDKETFDYYYDALHNFIDRHESKSESK